MVNVEHEVLLFTNIHDGELYYEPRVIRRVKELIVLRGIMYTWCKDNHELINPFYRERFKDKYVYDELRVVLDGNELPKLRSRHVISDDECYMHFLELFMRPITKHIKGIYSTDLHNFENSSVNKVFNHVLMDELKRFRQYFQNEMERVGNKINFKSFNIHRDIITTNREVLDMKYNPEIEIELLGIGPFKTHHKLTFDIYKNIKSFTIQLKDGKIYLKAIEVK